MIRPQLAKKGNALISSVACLWLRSAIDYSIHPPPPYQEGNETVETLGNNG